MRTLVTGACGQDGHYLCKLLVGYGYEVYGLYRRTSRDAEAMMVPGVDYIEGDVTDFGDWPHVEEVYHLAAQSHVGYSFRAPAETLRTNILGTQNVLDHAVSCDAKFYQASTSEMFGASTPPQDENTPFLPRSPYAVSKVAAYYLARNYADRGLSVWNGILFNHESPKRGGDFVTRKICRAAARIAAGEQKELFLGDIDTERDWGHAADYVRAMHMILQAAPGDYVVATGEMHSVKDVLNVAFEHLGLEWRKYVQISQRYARPTDVPALCGDATKVRAIGWQPTYTFESIIREMVEHEVSATDTAAERTAA